MPPNTVKVDRSTDHGNPYRVRRNGHGQYEVVAPGDRVRLTCTTKREAVGAAVDMFRDWITGGSYPAQRRAMLAIDRLRGRNLACWCSLDSPCHAEVLLQIANEGTTP